MALDFAGTLYKRVDDQESEQRCQLGAVRQMLRMRDECSQAGAKASWVMDALLRLRQIKGEEALGEKVYNRARALYLRKIVPINYVEPEMVTLYLSSGESSSALRVAG